MYFDPADRPALKEHAKDSIRQAKERGIPVTLVTIIYLVMQAAPSIISSTRMTSQVNILMNSGALDNATPQQMMELLQQMNVTSPGLSLVTLLLTIFLAIVGVGYQKYCLRISRHQHPGEIAALFDGFRDFGRYFGVLFLSGLFVFLWEMAGVIPGIILMVVGIALQSTAIILLSVAVVWVGVILGIIATFHYSQAVFAAIDDPDLAARDALRVSKDLMRGHKWEYFVLTLSFLGWTILIAMTAGILGIWIQPYMETTLASYYNGLIGWQPDDDTPAEPQPPVDEKEPEWWEK